VCSGLDDKKSKQAAAEQVISEATFWFATSPIVALRRSCYLIDEHETYSKIRLSYVYAYVLCTFITSLGSAL
jgi:hypothetical protein